ncbi:hypothetical protein BC828DRAFT_383128 [Blastocladiella britannica]|nr:hypothetical protein BC828DRAFT_383128 [Blastocladiella britannica]
MNKRLSLSANQFTSCTHIHMLLPDLVIDLVLAMAAGSLSRGLPYPAAARMIDTPALQTILATTTPAIAPHSARLGLYLLRHCSLENAAARGRMDILELRQRLGLDRNYSRNGKRCKNRNDDESAFAPLIAASRGGHLDVIEWILAHSESFRRHPPYSAEDQARAMAASSEAGQLAVLGFWGSSSAPHSVSDILKHHSHIVLPSAAQGGHTAILAWWSDRSDDRNLFSSTLYPRSMARSGHTRALSWWYLNCTGPDRAEPMHWWDTDDMTGFLRSASSFLLRSQLTLSKNDEDTDLLRLMQMDWAVVPGLTAAGRVDDLNWWHRVRDPRFPIVYLTSEGCLSDAPRAMLDWWWALGTKPKKFRRVARRAVQTGRIPELEWAISHNLPFANKIHRDKHSIQSALSDGHLPMLQWLYARHRRFVIEPRSLRLAGENGHVATLDWLARTATTVAFPWKGSDAVDAASQRGECAVLAWWLAASRDPTLPAGRVVFDYTHASMDNAPDFSTLVWWQKSGLALKYSRQALVLATSKGLEDVLNWWMTSQLPLLYDHTLLGSLTDESHVAGLEWWWASGLPLKVLIKDCLDRQEQGAMLDALIDPDPAANVPHPSVVRWWNDNLLADAASDRTEFTLEDGDPLVLSRAAWLAVVSPPSKWRLIHAQLGTLRRAVTLRRRSP